ncbi:hypothetical protein F5X99DRAFT_408422 [Biscogniauxia marginata]|nr:hypothetical protein F5X99DRAFT_408422 [Biscogniauxia marginata]
MAIIEFAFFQIKPDAETVKRADQSVIPGFAEDLKAGGALNGLRGWIESEDGRDVTSEFRELLVVEWPSVAAFQEFIKSAAYAKFQGVFKPLVAGPPALKLVEAGDVSNYFSADPVLEILEIRTRNTLDDVQDVLDKIRSVIGKNANHKAVYGSSLNLDRKEILIARLFTSQDELSTEAAGESRRELLATIGQLAEVTQLVVKVERLSI